MDPALYTPVSAADNLRRSAVFAGVLGVGALVLLSVAGHPLMGVFGLIGLALGAYNNLLLQQSVKRMASGDEFDKVRFRRGVMGRLGLITLLAIGAGVLIRPDGFGVFAGLAVFHIIMLIGASVPVFRSLRPVK